MVVVVVLEVKHNSEVGLDEVLTFGGIMFCY